MKASRSYGRALRSSVPATIPGCKKHWSGSLGGAERCRRRARSTLRSSARPRRAFGHIELDGACPEWAKQLALDGIDLDRRGIEALEAPWAHREERLARLTELERALVGAPQLRDD
jgi:hypothetical protein